MKAFVFSVCRMKAFVFAMNKIFCFSYIQNETSRMKPFLLPYLKFDFNFLTYQTNKLAFLYKLVANGQTQRKELKENVKIAISYFLVSLAAHLQFKARKPAFAILTLYTTFSQVLYVKNGKKFYNRNFLFHDNIMGPLTLSKQGYLSNCLKNL